MQFEKCFFCNNFRYVPYHITEINKDGKVESCNICEKCGKIYIENLMEKPKLVPKFVDLTDINTPEELLDFLSGIESKKDAIPPCECGWTDAKFEKAGRMGCPKCYDHFKNKIDKILFSYHGSNDHIGKRPKRQILEKTFKDPVEKIKILKLRFAKALELEKYEEAAKIKEELDQLTGI